MAGVRGHVSLWREAGRAVAPGKRLGRAPAAALLLIGALAALPAGAGDPSAVPPAVPVRLEVLDTSRPPAGANWVVLAAAEDASWRDQGGYRWHEFQQGQVLMPGSEIETGPGGEVVLVLGGDQVRIAPSTRLVLPAAGAGGQLLHHESGRLRVDVEPRPGRDFRVTTPLLSLGIKGTSFETSVDHGEDSVVVLDGEVEVRPLGREESVRLNEGQGLRQPAEPGAEPLRFELSPAEAGQARRDPTWQLGIGSRPDLREGHARGTDEAARAPRPEPRDGHNRVAWNFAPAWTWAEDGTTLLILGALAAAVVLLLAAPVMALCHNIFEHWLDRPATGRRRRDLTRG